MAQKLDYETLANIAHFSDKEIEIVKELWTSKFHIKWVPISREFLIQWLAAPDAPNIIDKFYIYLHGNFRQNIDYKIEDKKIYVIGRCLKYIIMMSDSPIAWNVIKVYLKFEQIAAMMLFSINMNKQEERNKKRLRNKDAQIAKNIIDLHRGGGQVSASMVKNAIALNNDVDKIVSSIVIANSAFNPDKKQEDIDFDKKMREIYLDLINITDKLAALA